MMEKLCPSCGRYQRADNLRRKKLPHGRIRLICVACIQRARTRSDVVPPHPVKDATQ